MSTETVAPSPAIPAAIADPKSRPRRSESIGKIGAALAKAQGEMQNAEKDVKGNYGKYATLAATWNAIRGPLSKNEIAIYQRPFEIDGKLKMCTMLLHSSGEFLDDGELEMLFDKSGGRITPMQAMGSAVTYARRYTLQAATGVAPEDDDDGNGAGKPQGPAPSGPLPEKKNQPATAAKEKAAAKPNNMAPAPQKLMDEITDLAIERAIPESILMHLVRKGYGFEGNVPPLWIAQEIATLLSNEDCNEASVMAQSQRVATRREAARLKAEGEKKK